MSQEASWKPDDFQTHLIFAYGGLMRGFDLHHYLAGAVFVDTGWTKGVLISLGRYPALIEGNAKVHGELYRLPQAAAALEALDDLEEFYPDDPVHSRYLRSSADIHASNGSTFKAWLYRYNQDPDDAPVIASGDWRDREQR